LRVRAGRRRRCCTLRVRFLRSRWSGLLGLAAGLRLRRGTRGLLGLPASFSFSGEAGPFFLLGLAPSFGLRRDTRGFLGLPASY
jgi:hypothetical protein